MGMDSFWMFDFVGTVIPIFIIVIIGIILLSVGKGVRQWNRNNKQPILTVGSRIVSKRNEISHHQRQNDQMSSYTRTSYYITFEVESGDRIEFIVEGEEYGMCAEGDTGRLTFQGTRYMGFQRKPRSVQEDA